jgi:hypothetical protein
LTNVTVVAEQQPVQPGDFFEIAYGGLVTAITDVQSTDGGTTYKRLVLASNPSTGFPVTDYRVMRGPRRVAGEDTVKMPTDIAVVVADVPTGAGAFSSYRYYSLNIPARKVPFGGTGQPTYYYEIVFSASGSVMGQGTFSGDKICVMVRDMTRGNNLDGTPSMAGDPVFVVVNTRTGAIGVQPVDVSATSSPYHYYTFTVDPRSSGM